MGFEILTLDGDIERVDEADAYQLEGPLTTFFISDGGHGKLSGWAQRVASLRTDRISSIRRVTPNVSLHGSLQGSQHGFGSVPLEHQGEVASARAEVPNLRAV